MTGCVILIKHFRIHYSTNPYDYEGQSKYNTVLERYISPDEANFIPISLHTTINLTIVYCSSIIY